MDPVETGIDPAHTSLQLLVNQWVEAFNAHDVSSIVTLYADDADLFDSGMKHPRHGRSEIEHWFARRFSDLPTITYTPTNQLFARQNPPILRTTTWRSPPLLRQSRL